uniref:SH3 domain-containing protein n=1 Tax=Arion vulgaris TaxID=1028688 RepID=A0A0B7BJ81_9EUPU
MFPPREERNISRLEKELEEKRRYINILELWLSNLEDLLKNKNKQTDRQLVEQLHQELIRLRSELKHIGYRSEEAVLDPASLMTELEHRNKEIISKRNEVDYLTDQLKKCQQECRNTEVMRQNTLDSLRTLEHELIDLQDKENNLHETQIELHSLRAQYESKCEDLNKGISERNELEFTLRKTILERDYTKCDLKKAEQENNQLKPAVEELTNKVEHLSRVEARKTSLEEQLNNLNSLLISRTEKTKEVYEENLILRDHVHQNETELLRLRNLCDDFNNLSARFDEMTNSKLQAISMIEPLQAKLERLARKCQEKDALLHRLGAELRHGTYRPSSALDDLERVENVLSQEEYNTDFLPKVNGSTMQMPERYTHRSPSSLDGGELSYPNSDSDSIPATTPKRKRPSPYVNNRPRSAETLGSGPRMQGGTHAHPHSVLEVRGSRAQPQFMGLKASLGHFVAIANYDPVLFSQSGSPGLELELKEGEIVHVTGPMNRTGYCEAEVNGRVGLVPANYLQQLQDSSHITGYHSDPWLSQQEQHGRRPNQMRDLHQEPPAKETDNQNVHRGGKSGQPLDTWNSNTQSLLPDPPSNLHVKNIMNESSILLSWLPPRLDSKGNSNGRKLLGFMVYLDNQEYAQILSPKMCEIVLEDLNLQQPYHLAVQSLYAGDYTSQRTEVIFEGIVRMVQGQGSIESAPDQEDLDTDLSSVLNSVHYKRGQRKTVIALYDYNPEQQSPLDYTYFELAFQAGQPIHVYGEQRPDGFFHGEIEGKRGLVPACFVEDLSKRTLTPSRKSH